MTASSGVAGGEGGSSGGTGSTGSNGGGGVDGAAPSIGAASHPTSSSSKALAAAKATGDARLWAAGVGAGVIGVVKGLV